MADEREGLAAGEERAAAMEGMPAGMPDEDAMSDLAELFKVFGDFTRIKILFALLKEPVCVTDLAEKLGLTQSAVSHQLRLLKQSRLVKSRREGKLVFYYLADDHVGTIIGQGIAHVTE